MISLIVTTFLKCQSNLGVWIVLGLFACSHLLMCYIRGTKPLNNLSPPG